jgi:perosamine synthetase
MVIKVSKPMIDYREINSVINVLKSGQYVSGKKVQEFESAFADYIGMKYAVACNSGTSALHMTLETLSKGLSYFEVIVPTMSFFSTVSSIMLAGGEPVFTEVDVYGQMDYSKIEKKINENTLAILPVHLF